MTKPEFTEEERKEGIKQIVELMNKFKLTIVTEQIVKIVPLELEDSNEEKK